MVRELRALIVMVLIVVHSDGGRWEGDGQGEEVGRVGHDTMLLSLCISIVNLTLFA
jgi:hypothetical protein